MATQVFLGGSCDPTSWRADTAIPFLTAAGVPFFNPQVAEWSPELVEIEAKAKDESSILLFVIDGKTRAMASMIEALTLVAQCRTIVVVVEDMTDGTVIAGQTVTGRELKDLNRARTYFLDSFKSLKGQGMVEANLDDALNQVVRLSKTFPRD